MIEALRSGDPERRSRATELLVRAYRGPVLDSIRWRWSLDPDDAEDRVQDFFATALEKEWLERFDPSRARFRTFLRMAAHRFVAKAVETEGRVKRGGGVVALSLDDVAEFVPDHEEERRFRDAWVRSIFDLALERLRREATARERTVHVTLFEEYDLVEHERPTYDALGARHGLGPSQVINHLAWARRRFRLHVLETLRSLSASDAEYRDDVRELLGIEA